ncbi:MAG: glucose 1-dehydrogenase [Chloroflexi bacterium]|nr:glucose 1-dehydrogenase [Chloroflexota bacterium]
MKAVTVTPRQPHSGRIRDVPRPDAAAGQALVQVLNVGICGTDSEIHEGLYGEAPAGSDYLILGHESFGRVVEAPAGGALAPGDLAAAVVRRPGQCVNCQRGEYDMCVDGDYRERGIRAMHGYMCEYYAESPEYLVKVPQQFKSIGVLMEPMSVVQKAIFQALKIQERMFWKPERALVVGAGPIGLLATLILRLRGIETYAVERTRKQSRTELLDEVGAGYIVTSEEPLLDAGKRLGRLDLIVEATGNASAVFESLQILGVNGVLCLTGVSGGTTRLEVPADQINLAMVLGNKTTFGSVNANRRYFEHGLADFEAAEQRWPGWLEQLITRRLPLDDFAEGLKRRRDDVKTILEVAS